MFHIRNACKYNPILSPFRNEHTGGKYRSVEPTESTQEMLRGHIDQLKAAMNEAVQKYWLFKHSICNVCFAEVAKENANSTCASRIWCWLLSDWGGGRKEIREGRLDSENFAEKQFRVRVIAASWTTKNQKGSELSPWVAVMGAGILWNADEGLQPSIDPADNWLPNDAS